MAFDGKKPRDFPRGRNLVALDLLASEIFGNRCWGHRTTKCGQCDHVEASVPWFSAHQSITEAPTLRSRYKQSYAISHWLAAQKIENANRNCLPSGVQKLLHRGSTPGQLTSKGGGDFSLLRRVLVLSCPARFLVCSLVACYADVPWHPAHHDVCLRVPLRESAR
jgi:hypothetical protein